MNFVSNDNHHQASETHAPRRNIPKATKRVRIFSTLVYRSITQTLLVVLEDCDFLRYSYIRGDTSCALE